MEYGDRLTPLMVTVGDSPDACLFVARTAKADTTVRGTRSDLLLWLANRGTPDVLDVSGRSGLLERWVQLRR